MKITVVGAALIIAAAIVVVLVVRALTSTNLNPAETGSTAESEDTIAQVNLCSQQRK